MVEEPRRKQSSHLNTSQQHQINDSFFFFLSFSKSEPQNVEGCQRWKLKDLKIYSHEKRLGSAGNSSDGAEACWRWAGSWKANGQRMAYPAHMGFLH
jgi:hypothetical protein